VGKVNMSDRGDFVFENVALENGENIFNAVAMSEKGGSSEVSKTVMVIYDSQPAEIVMMNPSEETLTVDYSDFDIVGKAEKNASVLINGRVAMVDDEGKFKLKFQLNAGKNEIEITVSDLAGNQTKKKITITYDI
jgi:bacillopeptidase F